MNMRLFMTLTSLSGHGEPWSVATDSAAAPGSPVELTVIGPSADPRVRISYGPLIPVPLDGESFIARVLSADLPPGTRLVEKRRAPNQTVTGYPMLLVHTVVENAEGIVQEARLTAFYNLLSVNAVATLRVRSSDGGKDNPSELLSRYEEPVKTAFRSATPDWETGICTIAALYEGLPALWERK